MADPIQTAHFTGALYALLDVTSRGAHQRSSRLAIGGVTATVVRGAYHLGEIRQALCAIK